MDNGFYTDSSRHINNYHEDGGDGGINRTNAAGLYGFMKREGGLGVGVAYTFTRAEHDPFLHLFSSPLPKGTDATQFVESLDNDFFAGTTYATECAEEWHLSANGNGPPITVLLPVYNGQGEVHAEKPNGLLSISLPLLQLATEMLSVLSEQAQLQENMTVAFFDSRGIIFVSNHRMFKMTESLQETDKMGTCLHTVRNTPRIEVNALANKLIADYGTLTPEPKVRVRNSVVSFQFDQRAYYGGDSSVLIDIPMDGNVRDVSGSEWDTRLHGCTNACFIKNPGDEATDDMSPEARRPEDHHHLSVLRLNGTQAVEILPYLTTRVPRVRSTSVKGTLDWHSTRSLYRTARPHDGVADVIHVAKPGRQAEPLLRERPIYNNEYTVAMYIRPAESQQEDSHRMQDKRRLFSDSRSVDGAVRLYADASFKVSLVRVGCSTPGMDIPHSVWTHVAATADFLTRSCVVFVNGTEVGRSRMRHSLYLPRLYGSYWIGEGFKGDIDGFKLLNRTSTAGDVRMLMATGEGVEAPSKLWSASLLTSHKATNIFPAAHAVLVPTEDVIRDVELNTQQINLVVAQQRSNTEWRHQRKSAETIAVAMVIVVAATCIFVVFNRLITTPFADFARDIHAVATMHVERVSASNSTSTLLREINVMNEAMNLLVSNMREYKTFLPESIFLLQQAASSVSEREAPGTETGQAAVVFTDIKQSSQLWETCHEGMRTGLRQHNAAVRECIDECAGYEVKTIGDSFMVAFDTLDSAVRFGLRVQERLTQVAWPESLLELAPCERDPTGDWAGIRVRIGVNYGPVSVEYNEVVGRSDYFGPTVNRAARLESCCVAGAVAVTDDMLVMLGDNMREQVHVMELGPRVLRGIADGVRVSVLIPKSLRRRAERVRNDLLLVRPNPLMSRIRDAERASDQGGLPNESSSDSTGSHRVRVADGIVRFTETMAAINSTTGQVGETLPEVSVRGPKDITFSVNATVMRIVSCLERSDGQVMTVVGGAAVVGWNVTSPCVAHMEGAFRFVGMLSRSAGDKLRCGLSSGRIMTGYVGSSGQRYVTAVGPCMQQCAALFYKAEALDANALYASWERSAADVTALGRFLRPIDELHIASRCMTVHEMWCRILRDWCGEKLTAQFGMPTRLAGAVGDAFTPPGDAPLLTAAETGCWTDQYRNAWRSRDFATLDALAQLDPMVAKASRIRRAMAPDDA